jgi:energy-coupling factor transport system ATP-binding protein
MDQSLVELKGVAVRTAGRPAGARDPLVDIDLTVGPGEWLAVVGANGSGKSTLLRLVAGIVRPSRGVLRLLGADAAAGPRARPVGLLLQNPDAQLVATRVAEEVAFGPRHAGVPTPELPGRVREALARVGLPVAQDRAVGALSGGERQLLALAGLVAMHPAVLCLDEPTAYLDAEGRARLLTVLRGLRDAGCAILHATHDMEEALLADRVMVLDRGSPVALGTPRQVLADPGRLRRWGVEPTPVTRIAVGAGWDAARDGPVPLDWAEWLAAVRRGGVPVAGGPQGGRAVAGRGGAVPGGASPGTGCGAAPRGIELRGVGLQRPVDWVGTQVRALVDVDLGLAPGRGLCVVGRAGAGKSSAALVTAGLVPPSSGRVCVDGVVVDPRRPWPRALRPRVAAVLQRPEDGLFGVSVREELEFAPRQLGWSAAATRRAVEEACAAVELPEWLLAASPFALSGGEMRRVAVAAALATGAAYVVLDEPTAGLDAAGVAAVRRLLRRLVSQGRGALVVTHRAEDVIALADEVCVFAAGRVVRHGSVSAVMADARLAAWGCDVPPGVVARRLLADCGAAGLRSRLDGCLSVEDVVRALAPAVPPPQPGW